MTSVFLRKLAFGAAIASVLSGSAWAMEVSVTEELGDLVLSEGWVRETIGPGTVSAGYLTIENTGEEADALIDAYADIADATELHTHVMSGGVMRMRRTEQIDVPAGETVSLEPGGDHIMLIGLSEPLGPWRRGRHHLDL